MDINETKCEVVGCVDLARDREPRRAVEYTVRNLLVP